MMIKILDEDGIREVELEQETIMCPICFATNDGWRKKCNNCGKNLEMIKCRN
jgi:hypothetical protein